MPVGRTPGSRTSKHFCCRHICLSPSVGWPRFSRDGRPEGSQPAFAARGCRPPPTGRPAAPSRPTPRRGGLTLYPTHYRSAFASSLIPSPLPRQLPLRVTFPCGEATGLLRSPFRSLRGKVVPFGRWRVIRDGGHCSPRTWPRTILVQAYQHLWLVSVDGLDRHFTWVDLTRTAGPRPPRCWQSPCRLALPRPIRGSRLRCPPGFGPRRCQ